MAFRSEKKLSRCLQSAKSPLKINAKVDSINMCAMQAHTPTQPENLSLEKSVMEMVNNFAYNLANNTQMGSLLLKFIVYTY